MILELMPSRAETYHVFLKTIACYLFIFFAAKIRIYLFYFLIFVLVYSFMRL